MAGWTTPIYNASRTGIYRVIVKTNCSIISGSIELVSPNNKDIFIPNVITPNNDGYNDSFIILGTDFPLRLIVVNRWGKEVYKSNSYNNKWTGQNLSSGVYYYLINIGCINQDFKGWLQILNE